MKIIIVLILLLQFNNVVNSQQIVGVYTPKKTFKIKDIFGKIPSYAFLQIKEDSTYYYETFWGSFETDKEHGDWKKYNDTLILIPKKRFSDTVNNYLEIRNLNNDSVRNGIRVRVMYSNYGLPDIKINVHKDNKIRNYVTNDSGFILIDINNSDYATIEDCDILNFVSDTIRIKKDYNDIIIHIDMKCYIVKREKLLNFDNKIVAKKRK